MRRQRPASALALIRFPVLLAACLLASGCCSLNHDRHFRGDGVLRDRGCWPFESYGLDLGAVDLAAAGEQTFDVAGLPEMEWVVGFTVPRQPGDPLCPEMRRQPWTAAIVEVEMSEVGGTAVFHRSAPLAEWTWTYAGGRDEAECQIYSRPAFRPPGRRARYRVTYRVLQPAPIASLAPTVLRDLRTTAVYSP